MERLQELALVSLRTLLTCSTSANPTMWSKRSWLGWFKIWWWERITRAYSCTSPVWQRSVFCKNKEMSTPSPGVELRCRDQAPYQRQMNYGDALSWHPWLRFNQACERWARVAFLEDSPNKRPKQITSLDGWRPIGGWFPLIRRPGLIVSHNKMCRLTWDSRLDSDYNSASDTTATFVNR